jgi:hypothetical protein
LISLPGWNPQARRFFRLHFEEVDPADHAVEEQIRQSFTTEIFRGSFTTKAGGAADTLLVQQSPQRQSRPQFELRAADRLVQIDGSVGITLYG